MPAATPLSLVKARLRIDHDADDALLAHLTDAAERYVETFTGQPLPRPIPADLTEAVMLEAVMLIVGSWFDGGMAPVPYGVGELLSAHKERITGHVPPEVTP